MNSELNVKLIRPDAKLPTKEHEQDAGWDLYATQNFTVEPWKKAVIDTGISISTKHDLSPGLGIEWRISSRSGLSAKHDLEVGAGVIDDTYRGKIMVILRNFSDVAYKGRAGDRIAQLVPHVILVRTDVKEVKTLDETDRGADGFGSTGI